MEPGPAPPRPRSLARQDDKDTARDNAASRRRTSTPQVRFDMAKLARLSGFEKIALFRDFVKYRMTVEALTVYRRLRENNIVQQLKYQDHHGIFHVLLSDPIAYKDDIIWTVDYMIGIKETLPSQDMLANFLKCCRKWGDLERARWTFDKMVELKLDIPTESWNDMLALYEMQSRDTVLLNQGVKLWEQMLTNRGIDSRPDINSYISVVTILGHLGRIADAEGIYRQAVEVLPELATDALVTQHRAIRGLGHPEAELTEKRFATRLFNTMLAVYADAGDFDAAFSLAAAYFEKGVLATTDKLSQASARDTYSLLLKVCSEARDLDAARRFFDDAQRRGVVPDAVMFGRMIQIHGVCGDLEGARTLFESALARLNLEPRSRRRHDLHTAFLHALLASAPIDRANAWFDTTYKDSVPEGKHILRIIYKTVISANQAAGKTDMVAKYGAEAKRIYGE
ncbi:hypothetical protein HK105_205429 [Polyrhizophydium stewartii]|uniref:Pentatricopeptide repeat-containing protein n=1 Tax=Polyrhizophydium stewartii TaxID=2732419 RepID=A0ABR4N6I7_9FUNG|nr:hypothetical protein HK105_006118 [Polyrhizophydium stewartii]